MLQKQQPYWQVSTLLIPPPPTVDCYIEYSRVLDPGSREHSDRYQTNGTWWEHFSTCRHGRRTECKASDACYRWQSSLPLDKACICFAAWFLAPARPLQKEKNPDGRKLTLYRHSWFDCTYAASHCAPGLKWNAPRRAKNKNPKDGKQLPLITTTMFDFLWSRKSGKCGT